MFLVNFGVWYEMIAVTFNQFNRFKSFYQWLSKHSDEMRPFTDNVMVTPHHHRLSISRPKIILTGDWRGGNGGGGNTSDYRPGITEQSDLTDGYLTGTGGLEDWTSQTQLTVHSH